ncbi:MAG TPA: pentapeptide repeat-containing protein [Mucilaginibacter sp.]|nr:pentapeptide repeat-containing protein [Mucilaginibacter sp.]
MHDDQIFEDISYAGQTVAGGEYNGCTFKKCDFTNSSFGNHKFIDCVFDGCNLSMMKLAKATLNGVAFKNCKILGVNFTECADFLFSVEFDGCILDYSSFMLKKMPKTRFRKSALKEVTFTQANLSGSVFDDCDLNGAVFNRTDISGANFITAYNYDIDPEINSVKKASFSAQGIHGLLSKYQLKIVG